MENISLEEGILQIKNTIKKLNTVETRPILKSMGHILAEDIVARYNNPPFNRSAVDGYACHSLDLFGVSRENPKTLEVIGQLNAGDDTIYSVKRGQCVRIMTGAMIPTDCDTCIMQEDTDMGRDTVTIYKEYKAFSNYCFEGEDYKKGEVLVEKGLQILLAEFGVIASCGLLEVPVYKKPKIAIISTGDEVVEVGEVLGRAKIFNSNLHLVEAILWEQGFSDVIKEHISDDYEVIGNRIKELYDEVDLVITTGGVSVGDRDIFHDVVKMPDFNRVFWKLKIQPGTPVMYSMFRDMPVISLSGNPFACIVNFELLVREALYAMYPIDTLPLKKEKGVMVSEFNKKGGSRRRFVRATIRDGKVSIDAQMHSPGALRNMLGCNALIDIPPYTEKLSVGDTVNVFHL